MGLHEELNIENFESPYYKAILNVIYTGQWLLNGINRVLKPVGLTEPQFNVLSVLFRHRTEPANMGDIAAGMVQKESNTTRIVDKLVARGWAVRETCPVNRRKVDVRITPEGRKVFREGHRRVKAFHASLEDRWPPGEAQRISDGLDSLRTSSES